MERTRWCVPGLGGQENQLTEFLTSTLAGMTKECHTQPCFTEIESLNPLFPNWLEN
jgi:hypothetical protein